jgi:mRNA interferase MazF
MIIFMKDFYSWNQKKIKIDGYKNYRHPKEREIWWCSIGVNVGTEIYGKGEDYTRPVLIINGEIGESFVGIPLTSKIKTGKYVCIIKTTEQLGTALVYQIRSFDKRRLVRKIGKVSHEDYKRVLECLFSVCKIL